MTDWEFVFDGVVGFLTSPMWNMPIVSFIEKHCIVFDTSDENMFALTEIHKEYSALVEELLTSYLKDVGITEEQFVMACEAGSQGGDKAKVEDRSIFEQVWAGEDFKLFKSMMVKKNLDLELQALHMIQQRNGVVPKVFESETEQSKPVASKSAHKKDEEKLLKEVIKLSEQEYEKDLSEQKEKDRKKEINRMEKTLALSSKEESERLFQMAEDELRNMERMVSLTLKLEGKNNAETSDSKKTAGGSRTDSPRGKEKVSSTQAKQSSSKSGKKSPSKMEKPASPSPKAKSSSSKKDEPAKSKPAKSEPTKSETGKPEPAKKEPSKAASEPAKQKTKTEEPKSVPVASAHTNKPSPKSPQQTGGPLPKLKQPSTPADAAQNWLSSAMAEAKTPSGNIASASKSGEQASMDDQIAKRAEYMRMQREKLLNLKKQERTKRLNTFEEQQPKRPMSSRVARRVTAGTAVEKSKANEIDAEQEKKLELRRALAARLKKEVINAE